MIFRQPKAYPTGEGPILLLPGEKFVARHVPLAEGLDITEQVELAVEACSPLPLTQLCWGFRTAPDRRSALAWMASRKHFTATEAAGWDQAAAVLPASLALCDPPATRPAIVVRHETGRVEAAAWDETAGVPVLLLARACAVDEAAAALPGLVAEMRRRTGLGAAAVVALGGAVSAARTPDGAGLRLHCGDRTMVVPWDDLVSCDIRNRDEIAGIGRRIARERLAWRATLAAAALVVAAAVADLACAAGGAWLQRSDRELVARAPQVEEVQSQHALAHRLGDLSAQRLEFMEMLDVLNGSRPDGLLFVRVASTGTQALEIKARTPRADDARLYESALKARPELRVVRVSDLQTRDGQTDFLIQAEFRPTTDGGMP